MKKTSIVSLGFSVISWILFFSVSNSRHLNDVLVLAIVSFGIGAASFFNITKLSLIGSTIAIVLSMGLALILVAVITLGEFVKHAQ
ncbi:hypothetical protein [Paenibacillus tengchongensis]|uniref:hypothetical protein n=1 Tax=Paenibacillus tengchongensis TaxID=2608684 RepID=UPI00124F1303|nr:hypothetical protein [Paenibacillus tengchongensis]